MSFWKSLFGGGSSADASKPAAVARTVEHNGFRIAAEPYPEGGQFQLAGTISKEIGGELKQHRYIRADRFSTMEDATDAAIMKGRQIVDQLGDRVFD